MAPRPSLPPSSKKRKLNNERKEDDDATQPIQTLETQLTAAVANKASLNPLSDLLDIARYANEPLSISKGIHALYRVFVLIITAGMLHGPSDETAKTVRSWLNDRLQGYTQLLVGLFKNQHLTLQTSALNILMSLQKHLSTSVTKTSTTGPQWHNAHFKQIVNGLLMCPSSIRSSRPQALPRKVAGSDRPDGLVNPEVRDLFVEKWLSVNDDVRWFFLRESAGILASFSTNSSPEVPVNLLSFLERLTTFPTETSELNSWWVEELGTKPPAPRASCDAEEDGDDETREDTVDPTVAAEDDWRNYFEDEVPVTEARKVHVRLHKLSVHQSLHSLGTHRAMFTRAWLSLLPHLAIGTEGSKKALAMRALSVMHRGVMPHLTRAVLIMDWVGSCVDYGGSVGLLSLNALFILMKEYNLDYPAFYTRLYAFLDRDVLHLKHRARFFRMTELFLSSTHLPVTLLASFVKRLARLSLSAPPAAIVMIIPFTYNILKRHPSLMVLIHRNAEGFEKDPFDNSELDPTKTQALESSLWELYTHRQHYHSAVSTLAKIFTEAFTKPNYALEDFLDHTYGTLLDTEIKRKIKKEPALATESTSQVWFQKSSNELMVDVIEELWCFA